MTSEQVRRLHADIQHLMDTMPAQRRLPAGWLAPVIPISAARSRRRRYDH